MPKYSVAKSIFIHAPVETVQAMVRDFRRWPEWSPWLIADPASQLEFSADGQGYAWDGPVTGSGELLLLRETPRHSITCQLTFFKPWKSVNSVRFVLEEKDGGTELTWTMDGSLPVFLFWMRSMMSHYLGADFQRGLMMLKAVIETGSNPSKLGFPGPKPFPSHRYVGVKSRCAIPEISASMQNDMGRLMEWLGNEGPAPSGKPFSICHKWDLGKGITNYTLAFPFDPAPTVVPDGFVAGTIPACNVYQVRHTGPYRFLGNAWAAGVMHGRAKLYQPDRRIDPFEVYENDPTTVAENELVTVLHFPVK